MVTFGAPVALSNPGSIAVGAAREIVGESVSRVMITS